MFNGSNRPCNSPKQTGRNEGCFSVQMVAQELFFRDFPGGTVVKNPPANAGDMGSIPDLGGSHMPRSNKARATRPVRHNH